MIAAIVTWVLVIGIRESAGFNTAMVAIKLVVVFFVIGVGAFYVDPANWKPFAPFGLGGVSFFGHTVWGQAGPAGEPLGMLAGAAVIFFAYIGFDSVSTHAEEAVRPQRDVPIGIITSLVLCTVLYVAVAAILTGMVPYGKINIDAPVSDAFRQAGLPWAQLLISIGALTGIIVATLGAFLPLRILAELVNIGTLLAFVIVCAAVLIMRIKHPEAERPFRAPFAPWTPILGIITCLILMFSLPVENWVRLAVWLAAGFVIYFGYGKQHSVMARLARGEKVAGLPALD